MKLQQEMATAKQRILFVEKHGPELEAEKKLAASARNFKEAGRLAAEAKALMAEKEDLTGNIAQISSRIHALEEEGVAKVSYTKNILYFISGANGKVSVLEMNSIQSTTLSTLFLVKEEAVYI